MLHADRDMHEDIRLCPFCNGLGIVLESNTKWIECLNCFGTGEVSHKNKRKRRYRDGEKRKTKEEADS